MLIEFLFSEEEYKVFDEQKIEDWIKNVIGLEEKKVGEIIYNFVSEEEILKINGEFLDHHYYTDIITFDDSFVNIINGSIFVSSETVKSNAQILKNAYIQELYRVIIHGIMHLCGYKDKTESEQKNMRNLEDKYLCYLEKL